MSVIRDLEEKLEQVKKAVNEIRLEMKRVRSPNVESNATTHTPSDNSITGETVPVEELIVLDGSLEGRRVQVLKDDGCNTNVLSREFFEKNKNRLKWRECDVEVRHSKQDSVEKSSEVVIGATLIIEKHVYKSNWLVANCRYDVLLGIPWHVSNNPDTNYEHRTVKVGFHSLCSYESSTKDKSEVFNMSVKKFRNLISSQNSNKSVQIFQLVP